MTMARNHPVKRLTLRMGLVMLAVAALLIGIVFYSGRAMDTAARDNEIMLADNAVTGRLIKANSELRSVSWWDEAVTKSGARNFDRQWLDLEVGAFIVDSYNHDRLIILDERNQPIYWFGEGAETLTEANTVKWSAVAPLIAQVRGGKNVSPRIKNMALLSGIQTSGSNGRRKTGRSAGAVLKIDGKPVLVSVMEITPSVNEALKPAVPRLLVTAIDVNAEFLADIGSTALLANLRVIRGAESRSGMFTLKSDDGQFITQFGWDAKSPGQVMIGQVLPWILGSLAIACAFLIILMIKLNDSAARLSLREEEARFLANHDALTGLPNRRYLEQLFNNHFANPDWQDARVLIACLDLDRFKDINDTLGHHAGDSLIRAVAARLGSLLAPGDSLARLGGDEFAVLRRVRQHDLGTDFTQLLSLCFTEPFDVIGHRIETAGSMGVYVAGPTTSFDQAMRQADIALYDAKSEGRGRISMFTPAMAKRIEERRAIETDLKQAIINKELTLAYQPIVEAATGAITSVEALVRWHSPIHGQVSPEIFVGVAEEAGMMADLGRFVIGQAMADAARWPQLTTAINISPAQLRSSTILDDLLGPAQRLNIDPTRIVIEITESVLMANDERTLRVLNALKDAGFSLALDDFGTGYSSLSYIRDFPFDKLKIDRSFVKGLSVNDRALAVVEGVVNFGRILGREIVAEGIETEQEMQAMQAAGCTHLQGYLFSRPLPADHVEALAATFSRSMDRPAVQGAKSAKLIPIRRKRAG
jgi:diguanylate cyclase (GGDEF)-like protein